MNIVGRTLIEEHYKREIRPLEELYDRKVKRLEKAEKETDHGLIIILSDEVEAIKCALLAGIMLTQAYLENLSELVKKLKAANKETEEWKHHLKYALLDVKPTPIDELLKSEQCRQ
jgi:hypothetical protein